MRNNLSSMLIRKAMDAVPRILGLQDREPDSPTFGCFDRPYWRYRTSDFPSAWFQWGFYLLALAWAANVPENPYYQNPNIRLWANAGLRFLVRQIRRDGSLDEVYPFERSYCAAAFGGVYITESVQKIGIDLPSDACRIAQYLQLEGMGAPSNQLAAVALALLNFHRLSGEEKYRRAALENIETLINGQAPEGYFPEYDGPDVGYQTVTIALLAKTLPEGETLLKGSLERGLGFLESRISDEGVFNYRVTSRMTQFIWPSGLARLHSPVLEHFGNGLRTGKVMIPNWLDDRYVAPLAIDFLETALELQSSC